MISSIKKFFSDNIVIKKLNSFYESILYPALISLIILLSYIFKTEVLGVCASIFLLSVGLIICKDLKPLIPLLLGFILFIPNKEGFVVCSPAYIEYVLGYLPYIIVLTCFLILSFILHFILWGGFIKIFTKPSKLLLYSLPFALLICLNGLFSQNYSISNLIFAIVTDFCLIGLFAIFINNLTYEQNTIDFFFKTCACLAVVIIAEYITMYLSQPNFGDGKLFKYAINLGWGNSNNYGNYGCYLIAPIFYLAYKSKKQHQVILYYILGVLTNAFVWLSLSRNGILTSCIITTFILIFLCLKGENKKLCFKLIIGTIIFAVLLVIALLIIVYAFKIEIKLFEELTNLGFSDSGRFALWGNAFNAFLAYPIFGQGFFACEFESWTGFIPGMYHNTIFQLLGTCGILTLLAYCLYRYKTIKVILYKLNDEKIFLGIIIFVLAFSSLLDNFIFHIYPTFFYVIALALCDLHYEKEKSLEKSLLKN